MSSSSSQYIATPPGAVLTEAQNPILTEALEVLTVDGSSSSSSIDPELALVLDNISLFRAYSLDASLIEEYFNKGVLVDEVDLDAFQSSSSSSAGPFSLTILLSRNYTDPIQRSLPFPEDLQFFIYDETVNGSASSGMIHVEKIVGIDGVLVTLNSAVPNGSDEYAFQINIEHPELDPYAAKFRFRSDRPYFHEASISYITLNRPRRLSPDYKSYLLNWIAQFWAGYDLDPSFKAPIDRPPGRLQLEFDPFAHARWRLGRDLAAQYPFLIMSGMTFDGNGLSVGMPDLTPTVDTTQGPPVVSGWNFLGVFPQTWACISPEPPAPGLYFVAKNDQGIPDPERSAGDFDCKDYSAATIFFLRSQLQSQCPDAKVYIQYVGVTGGPKHALLLVDLGGSSACCTGKFLYEPQNGAVYKTIGEFCQGGRKVYCGDNDFSWWKTADEGKENVGSWLSDWAYDPAAMARIKNVICSCMPSSPSPGSSEEVIKTKCDAPDPAFNDWFIDNFKFAAGKTTSPMTGIPQILSCEKSICMPYPTTDEEKCLKDPDGTITPYACEQQCIKKWDCPCRNTDNSEVASYSLRGTNKPYLSESDCGIYCQRGAWCVRSGGNKTGECKEGTYQEQIDARDRGETGPDDFVPGATCESLNCCPPGKKKFSSSSPQLLSGSQFQVCLDSCTNDLCEQGYCCVENPFSPGIGECIICDQGYCCYPIDSEFSYCLPCDKTRALRMEGQATHERITGGRAPLLGDV